MSTANSSCPSPFPLPLSLSLSLLNIQQRPQINVYSNTQNAHSYAHTDWFIGPAESFICSVVQLLSRSFNRSLVHSLTCSVAHSLIRSCNGKHNKNYSFHVAFGTRVEIFHRRDEHVYVCVCVCMWHMAPTLALTSVRYHTLVTICQYVRVCVCVCGCVCSSARELLTCNVLCIAFLIKAKRSKAKHNVTSSNSRHQQGGRQEGEGGREKWLGQPDDDGTTCPRVCVL